MVDETINEAPQSIKDKLGSKRFVLPALGMYFVYDLVKGTPEQIKLGCLIIASIAAGALAVEFVLKYKGKWNGKKATKEI